MDTEQILDACLEKALMLHDLNYPTTVVLGKGGNSIKRGEPRLFPERKYSRDERLRKNLYNKRMGKKQ